MHFSKLHGLGNDFVFLSGLDQNLTAYRLPRLAEVLCDRHFGIGADGLIVVLPSEVADFRMRIFNPDGSESEMCGNGIRAFAKYVYDRGLTARTDLTVETGAGIIRPSLTVEHGKVTLVRVDMGEPRLAREEIPMLGEPADQPVIALPLTVGEHTLHITCVSMGNPHCVTFVPDAARFPVSEVGPLVERYELFPRKTNVEFATVVSREHIIMRVWERGAGITLACGTGASATLVAAVLNDLTERQATVSLLGGDLQIEWAPDNHVFMTGPAESVFEGEVAETLLTAART